MANSPDHYLQMVLNSYHRNRLPRKKVKAIHAMRMEIVRFLQQNYPQHSARAGNPFTSGSFAKKTDINVHFDLDIVVPFRHGFGKDVAALKESLYEDLKLAFGSAGATVRKGANAIGLKILRGVDTLEFDVLPAVELEPNQFSQQKADPNDERKFLSIFQQECPGGPGNAITTNLHAQKRIVQKEGHSIRPVIKLLKVWKFHAGFRLPSFSLEMMAVEAFREKKFEGKRSPSKLLAHVLKHMVPKLFGDQALQDSGSKRFDKHFLTAEEKEALAAHFQAILEALAKKDLQALAEFFPQSQYADTKNE